MQAECARDIPLFPSWRPPRPRQFWRPMMDPLPPKLPADGVRCKKQLASPDALRGSVRAGHASQQLKAQSVTKTPIMAQTAANSANYLLSVQKSALSLIAKDIKHFHAFSRFTTKRIVSIRSKSSTSSGPNRHE